MTFAIALPAGFPTFHSRSWWADALSDCYAAKASLAPGAGWCPEAYSTTSGPPMNSNHALEARVSRSFEKFTA